jgi:hypothetical protein
VCVCVYVLVVMRGHCPSLRGIAPRHRPCARHVASVRESSARAERQGAVVEGDMHMHARHPPA